MLDDHLLALVYLDVLNWFRSFKHLSLCFVVVNVLIKGEIEKPSVVYSICVMSN